ncbi:MAG: hypothetical protein M3Y41_13680, partial [Pseudomonadota bacterium]|nr:hypothetical protein [Pseudomonadota bacterium]
MNDASQTTTPVKPAASQLDYLPIGLFGAAMGLTGLSVAWRLAHARYGGPAWLALVAPAIGIVATIVFFVILFGYCIKLLTAFDAVRTEFRHPIAGNLGAVADVVEIGWWRSLW